jgi:hypothetical protein
MTPAQEVRARELIDKHVAMSGQTLDALRKAGLTDEQEVQLGFFFDAPNEKFARALTKHLQANGCLDVRCEKSRGFLSRRWVVTGKTYPTAVTVHVLAEWLPWIVVQGISHGCEFDGWGAEV